MAWTIEVSPAAEHDIELLFDHFANGYVTFGDSRSTAAARSLERVDQILEVAERIAVAPFRGEALDEMAPGLRHLTLGRAVYWYQVDEEVRRIRILAIFYGGQDHVRQMLLRLLSR